MIVTAQSTVLRRCSLLVPDFFKSLSAGTWAELRLQTAGPQDRAHAVSFLGRASSEKCGTCFTNRSANSDDALIALRTTTSPCFSASSVPVANGPRTCIEMAASVETANHEAVRPSLRGPFQPDGAKPINLPSRKCENPGKPLPGFSFCLLPFAAAGAPVTSPEGFSAAPGWSRHRNPGRPRRRGRCGRPSRPAAPVTPAP